MPSLAAESLNLENSFRTLAPGFEADNHGEYENTGKAI
jgi:hypothetical protein